MSSSSSSHVMPMTETEMQYFANLFPMLNDYLPSVLSGIVTEYLRVPMEHAAYGEELGKGFLLAGRPCTFVRAEAHEYIAAACPLLNPSFRYQSGNPVVAWKADDKVCILRGCKHGMNPTLMLLLNAGYRFVERLRTKI
jgi:hypothetical protein